MARHEDGDRCPHCGEHLRPSLWALTPQSKFRPPQLTCPACGKVSIVTRACYGVAMVCGLVVLGLVIWSCLALPTWLGTVISLAAFFATIAGVTRLTLRLQKLDYR